MFETVEEVRNLDGRENDRQIEMPMSSVQSKKAEIWETRCKRAFSLDYARFVSWHSLWRKTYCVREHALTLRLLN